MIPQTCRYKNQNFECGLSISCVLGGGKPIDLCSGGMIWSCCVDKELHSESNPSHGAIQNASKYIFIQNQQFSSLSFSISLLIHIYFHPKRTMIIIII